MFSRYFPGCVRHFQRGHLTVNLFHFFRIFCFSPCAPFSVFRFLHSKNFSPTDIRLAHRTSSSLADKSFGIAFDIDGVLYRGRRLIPGVSKVLQGLLERNIPWILLTNSGGFSEEKRAVDLSKKFNCAIDPSRIQQCHTPFRKYVQRYQDLLIMVTGAEGAKEIAMEYGFKKVISTADVHAIHPGIFSRRVPLVNISHSQREIDMLKSEPISAIFAFMDPTDYLLDLQIVSDVIFNNGYLLGCDSKSPRKINVCFSGPDLHYADDWQAPRLGAGFYPLMLQTLFRKCGKELEYTIYGKPYGTSFQYAQEMIEDICQQKNIPSVQTIYMIGDNPNSDIKGANSYGGKWKSVLVRTGVFDLKELNNDPKYPADIVADNVGHAIEQIEKLHSR